MTESPPWRIHISKTTGMGPYKTTSRSKHYGYIGRMNVWKSHWKQGDEPRNHATWRIYPPWRIPPIRKRRWKTERST